MLEGWLGIQEIARMLVPATIAVHILKAIRKPYRSRRARVKNGQADPTMFLQDKTTP